MTMEHISKILKRGYTYGWACSLNPMMLFHPLGIMNHRVNCKGVHWKTNKIIKK